SLWNWAGCFSSKSARLASTSGSNGAPGSVFAFSTNFSRRSATTSACSIISIIFFSVSAVMFPLRFEAHQHVIAIHPGRRSRDPDEPTVACPSQRGGLSRPFPGLVSVGEHDDLLNFGRKIQRAEARRR